MIKKTLQNQDLRKIIKFGITGISGIGVNMGVFYILTHIYTLNYKIASPIAIEISILSNFLINNFWTWRDVSTGSFFQKIVKYHTTAAISGIINYLILIALADGYHVDKLLANFIGIGVASGINFVLNNFWTFK